MTQRVHTPPYNALTRTFQHPTPALQQAAEAAAPAAAMDEEEAAAAPPAAPSEKVKEAEKEALKLLEFYFGDSNFGWDRFMQSKVRCGVRLG